MQLTSAERLILVMLSEIYKKLEIEGEIDPDFVLDSIARNQVWGLSNEYSLLLRDEEPHPKLVTETYDILDMYKMLHNSYKELSKADRERIAKEAAPFGDDVNFPGFDGNHEPHFHIAGYMVETLGQYKDIGADRNSHSRSVPIYKRMLNAYRPLQNSVGAKLLGADQIIKVLKVRKHG
jgi:uncharacterized protein